MRNWTFKGFLSHYVRKLSCSNTQDIKRLAEESLAGNVRLQAPLVLYAVAADKKGLLMKSLPESGEGHAMRKMLEGFDSENLESILSEGRAPEEYLKVWNSFLVSRNAPMRDEALKCEMRKKVLRLMEEKDCTNYRIYTDLKLNPGNINNWLKNGVSSMVSFDTAEKVMNYVVRY